jgi:hypothetical protein
MGRWCIREKNTLTEPRRCPIIDNLKILPQLFATKKNFRWSPPREKKAAKKFPTKKRPAKNFQQNATIPVLQNRSKTSTFDGEKLEPQ